MYQAGTCKRSWIQRPSGSKMMVKNTHPLALMCFTTLWCSWITNNQLFSFPNLLFILCFSGFVELNHMLTSCYPPLSANSTSGPLRLLQKQRKRGREREGWTSQGHLLLDVLKLWNSERICTCLVSPGTFFFCTHIHTSFPTKPCLNDSYLFWTTKKTFTWTMRREKK